MIAPETALAKSDLVGRKFGRLTAIERDDRFVNGKKIVYWKCLCDCGREHSVRVYSLLNSAVRSCGCFQRESAAKRSLKHGIYAGMRNKEPSFMTTWRGMLYRCEKPTFPAYKNYGGRGIRVCDRWRLGDGERQGFECFRDDMGPKPTSSHTLDRIDNEGNYEPSNCRWASRREQGLNTRVNHHVTLAGRRVTLTEAAESTGIPYNVLQGRLKNGWDEAKALATPHSSKEDSHASR